MKAVLIGDHEIRETASTSLKLVWPDVALRAAHMATEGLELVRLVFPDIVLFCGMPLPATIQALRRLNTMPVLVLAYQYKGDEGEVVTALQAGADVYIRLPCGPSEITAWVGALLRRQPSPQTAEQMAR